MSPVTIRSEETPNPAARRYVVDRPVQEQSKGRFFTSADDADEPLAQRLLTLDGVAAVMLLPNSITVTKAKDAAWADLDRDARAAIESYFS